MPCYLSWGGAIEPVWCRFPADSLSGAAPGFVQWHPFPANLFAWERAVQEDDGSSRPERAAYPQTDASCLRAVPTGARHPSSWTATSIATYLGEGYRVTG